MGHDRDGYEVYSRPRRATYYLDGPLQTGILYPGGAHRTWGHSRGAETPYWKRNATELSAEPEGAAKQRRLDKAEDKRRERDGERLHPIDPTDPWSAAAWSPCEPGCTIHNT